MTTRSAEGLDSVLEAFEQAWRSGPPPLADYLPPPGSSARLPALVALARIDLERRLEAGEPARVEALYLSAFPELESDAEAVLGLVRLEWELRRRAHPGLSAQEFFDRFPTLRGELERLLTPAPSTVPGMVLAPVPSSALPEVPGCSMLGELGKGGMGEVYRGRDPVLGRELAVKVLGAQCLGDPDLAERFVAEAQVAGQLQHPGVVPVYALGRLADGRPYFTMKLVKGRNLAELLEQRRDTHEGLARFVSIFEQVCQALAYAHSRGVVHRDLKPANVMVGAFGEVQVMDWGLAKVLDRRERQRPEEQPGTNIQTVRSAGGPNGARTGRAGTPAYAAPEQARGEMDLIGPAADVFGLGAILCVVLTGEAPFAAKDAREALRLAMAGNLAGAFARLDGCGADPELVALCKDCLAPEPERRPQDAAAVAQRVGAYQARVEERLRLAEKERAAAQAREQEARATAQAEKRAAQAERRRRRQTVGLAATAVLLVALGAGAGWRWRQQRAEAGQKTRLALDRGQKLLDDGWREHDLGKLKEAKVEADRAVDVAAGADEQVRRQATNLQKEAESRLGRAEKNRALLTGLLEVSAPRELTAYEPNDTGQLVAQAEPSVDKQYARAFRAWGLDVDSAPEEDVVARLLAEPAAVREEVVAGLDGWMHERRRDRQPEAKWRRLRRVADRVDEGQASRRLRALLAGEGGPAALGVAALVGALGGPAPWAAPSDRERDARWRVVGLRARVRPEREPVLTVLLLARASQEVGDVAGAEAVLRQALAARPNQVVLLDALGRLLQDQGGEKRREALEFFRAARAARPDLGFSLARALRDAGKAPEGEAVLRDLLRQRPNHPELHFSLGYFLLGQQKSAEAEKACRKAIELRPEYAPAHYNLGLALARQKRDAEAERAYRRALELRPDYPRASLALCNLLLQQKRPAEAEQVMRRALQSQPESAEAHASLGNVLREQKRYAEAERALRRSLALRPDHASAHLNLGIALAEQKRPAEAEEAFRKAIRLRPDHAPSFYSLGLVLREQKKNADAERGFRRAIELRPAYPEAHNNLGVVLLGQGRYAEAERAFRRATELNPDGAQAHFNLGLALVGQKRPAEAERAFRRATELQADYAVAHRFLGVTLSEQKRYAEAEKALRRAIELRPNYPEAHNNLGLALRALKRPAEAEKALLRAIQLRPNFPEAHNILGNALSDQKRLAEAEKAYRRAIELQPDYPEAHNNLGVVLHSQGRPVESEKACRKAIALRPDDPEAYHNLGNALHSQKRHAEAEKAYRRAIQLRPDLALAYTHLGLVLDDLKRPAEAEKALRKAIELRPDLPEAQNNLAYFLRRQNRPVEAEKACRRALALRPDYPDAYYNLGNALRSQKRPAEAEKAFRRAIQLRPADGLAHANLGLALIDLKRLGEAELAFRKAAELRPDDATAHYSLGTALLHLARPSEAEKPLRRAVRLRPDDAGAHNNLGVALREQKKLDESVMAFRRATQLQPAVAGAHYNLGNALRDQMRLAEAEKAYRRAVQLGPDRASAHRDLGLTLNDLKRPAEAVKALRKADQLSPGDQVTRDALGRAEHLLRLDHKLTSCLEGKSSPVSPLEGLELAEHCGDYRERPRTALRFSLDAFENEPALADELIGQHRHHAACFAALAAAGKGKDAVALPEEARAGLRLLAFAWLRADLEAHRRFLDDKKGPPPLVREWLTSWLHNINLASVRAPAALAALPTAERAAWRKLWADVEALRKRAGAER
jgi:tetratricopeptide (TPR) repeat protein